MGAYGMGKALGMHVGYENRAHGRAKVGALDPRRWFLSWVVRVSLTGKLYILDRRAKLASELSRRA